MESIVVVNDDQTQLRFQALLLRKSGFDVSAYHDAVSALQDMQHNGPPSLIITDLYMPQIDGWRFCRLLRSGEYTAFNSVPILVISATFAGANPRLISKDLGANAFLSSPFDIKDFLETVNSLINHRDPNVKDSVLIIEDSASVNDVIADKFASSGYRVFSAYSAAEGRECFLREQPDVAIVDYHLPDFNGDELLAEFHDKSPECTSIMITVDTRPDLALKWMEDGAAAYVRKPFESDYLYRICERSRRERALLHVEERLEVRTQELKILLDRSRMEQELIARIAASEESKRGDIDALVRRMTKAAVEVSGLSRSGVWLFDEGTSELRCVFSYDADKQEYLSGTVIKDHEGEFLETAFKTGNSFVIADTSKSENMPAFTAEYILNAGIGAFMVAVIRVHGKPAGVLSLAQNGSSHLWEQHEISFACQLADQIALTIVNKERQEDLSEIRRLLSEKDRLLQEVHHRIKNNMNTIAGFLTIKSDQVRDDTASEALMDMRGRVVSMMKIYDLLYRSGNYNTIGLDTYLTPILEELRRAYIIDQEKIKLDFDIDDVTVKIKPSISIGIMVNELVGNALKYAFKDAENGRIFVEVKKQSADDILLTVEDNGIGMNGRLTESENQGLGMVLVEGLADELNADFSCTCEHGTKWRILIPDQAM
jgi:two-component sensor histidine kinase/DNA-binding response OmpR family regulator